jgi:hypothetical protein
MVVTIAVRSVRHPIAEGVPDGAWVGVVMENLAGWDG